MTISRAHGGRFGYIDSLRGFGAFAVVYMHFLDHYRLLGQSQFQHYVDWGFTHIIDGGKIGVIVFFAISGFLIPSSLAGPDIGVVVKKFVISRFFRLYPAYWVSIISASAIIVLSGYHLDILNVAVNVTMFQRFFGVPDILGVYWTLQIEIIFYMICIILFYLGVLADRRAVFRIAAAILLIALAISAGRFILDLKLPVAIPLSLAIMFWGYLCRMNIDEGRTFEPHSFRLTILIILLIFPISILSYNHDMGYGETWYRYVNSYLLAMIVFSTGINVLRVSWLSWFGKISYSVYLLHSFVLFCMFRYAKEFLVSAGFFWAGIIAFFLVSMLSALIFYTVEQPFIRFGRGQTRVIANAAGLKCHPTFE